MLEERTEKKKEVLVPKPSQLQVPVNTLEKGIHYRKKHHTLLYQKANHIRNKSMESPIYKWIKNAHSIFTKEEIPIGSVLICQSCHNKVQKNG